MVPYQKCGSTSPDSLSPEEQDCTEICILLACYTRLSINVAGHQVSNFHNSSSMASCDQLLQTSPALYKSSLDRKEKIANAVVFGCAGNRNPKKGNVTSS